MSAQDTTLPRRARAPEVPRELALVVLCSPDARARLRRLSPRGLQLGRGEESSRGAWSITDPMLSRKHAEVIWDEDRGSFMLSDCGSRNGTQLDGHDIQSELLLPGAIARVGDTVLRVVELDPDLEPEWSAPGDARLCGRSASLQRLTRDIAAMAPSDMTVLVEGETGTGKELVARELHDRSGRTGAFWAINCAAIVESLVESELFGHRAGAFSGATEDRTGAFVVAHEGTLLLDEIGELPAAAQAKLLRVLEERMVHPVGGAKGIPVDVRIVCATNRDLRGEVDRGAFRADLYARVHQLTLRTAPLRERPEDLEPLIDRVLRDHGTGACRVSADVIEAMALYAWPFNVRELVALVRKVLVRKGASGTIELEDVAGELPLPAAPEDVGVEAKLPRPKGEPTRAELVRVLEHFSGRVSDAARHLGRGRTQLYRWMGKHDIDPSAYR